MTGLAYLSANWIIDQAYEYGQRKINEKFVVSVKNKLDWAFGGIWQCVLVQTIPWYTSTSPIKEFEFILGNMRMKCILPKMYNPQDIYRAI